VLLALLMLTTCSTAPSTLEEVLESGELRVITRNGPTTFYRGPLGYEGPEFYRVEAFRAFLEEKYGRSITVDYQIADTMNEVFSALESGRVHLAAASLTVTEARKQRVQFGPSYQNVSQFLVYRLNSGRPRDFEDLRGKRLEVLAGSSFAETLRVRQAEHPELAWAEVPYAETSDLLQAVQDRELDYTVVDSIDYYVHRFYMPDLRPAFEIKAEDRLAWGFPRDATGLPAEAATFFDSQDEQGLQAQIEERYYSHINRFDYVGTRTFRRHYKSRLPAFREMFRKASQQTGLDWRLLAAIGYQESHWNPDAVSPTGVRGLMMLTSTTAGGLGVQDRHDAAESIAAGSQYLLNIYNRLDNIPHPDRTWFALAAYNVGYGHLQDARRLARMHGEDPDSWQVIKTKLPLLAKREFHTQVPYGYARGWEPVGYVENVRTYFEILSWLTLDDEPVQQENPITIYAEPQIQTASSDAANTAT